MINKLIFALKLVLPTFILILFISFALYFRLNREKCECHYQKSSGKEFVFYGKCPKIQGGFIVLKGEKIKVKKIKTNCE
jgi:Zn finger protein HypA/HybF involved in hydrogenase expression